MSRCRLRWFDLPDDRELPPDGDGVCRLRSFRGLWVHDEALPAKDYGRLMTTLQQGLASPEHAAFVEKLAAAGRSREWPSLLVEYRLPSLHRGISRV